MHRFDKKDFTKTAFSLAAGMACLAAFTYWYTQGDILMLCISAGMPVGVVAFWAVFYVKHNLSHKRSIKLSSMSYHHELTNSQFSRLGPKSALGSSERVVANFHSAEDKDRNRILSGRSRSLPPKKIEEYETEDQWFLE